MDQEKAGTSSVPPTVSRASVRSRKRTQTFRAVIARAKSVLHPEDYEGLRNSPDPELSRSNKKMKLLPHMEHELRQVTDLCLAEQWHEALAKFERLPVELCTAAVLAQCITCYMRVGQNGKAFELAERLVEMEKHSRAAWETYEQLAGELEKQGQQLKAWKALVDLKDLSDEDRLKYLREIDNAIEDNNLEGKLKYSLQLLPLEVRHCSEEDSIPLHVNIAKYYLALKQPEEAVKFLTEFVQLMLSRVQDLGRDTATQEMNIRPAVMLLLTAYLDCTRPDDAASLIIHDAEIVEIFHTDRKSGERRRTFSWQSAEEVRIKEEYAGDVGLVAAICTALFQTDQTKFPLVKKLIGSHINPANTPVKTTTVEIQTDQRDQLLRLARALLNHGQPQTAREVMKYITTVIFATCTEETHFFAGTVHESCQDVTAALHSYDICLTKKPDFRPAQLRMTALEMEFPNTVAVSTLSDNVRQKLVAEQLMAYSDYVNCRLLERADGLVVANVLKMVEKSFEGAVTIEPGKFLWALHTPYALEKGLKRYLLSAPVLAEKKVKLGEFWRAIMDGCCTAFKMHRYADMISIAFSSIRTTEIAVIPKKLDQLKEALVVAAFYLPPSDEPDPLTGTVVNTRKFSFDYLREQLNRLRQECDFSVHKWSFYYHLATNPELVEPGQVVKWATHWVGKNGYKREISMILANDSMRRGSYPHAHKLYSEIVQRDGETNVPWIVFLHLGTLCANLACRFRVSDAEKQRLYAECMRHLDKYRDNRGYCPEVLYNRARAYHLFGDAENAVEYYHKCLQLIQNTTDEDDGAADDNASLAFEAAYNLRCLYAHKQQKALAAGVLSWQTVKSFARGITFRS
ncbi:uncharacterized protein LOC129602117 [Paramacrobiotus metropolitanus]|uniref:uncharacterized protein LOC129602117 n=1 Tax=Paramacrobiotus metropolitanus TaxID=2943436 RepID=UPI0024457804|nr:uncharacterized protein LOC129602117 [Paramacrobiotus metropolitanus]